MNRARRRGEDGVAMVAAMVVMLLVLAVIAIFSMLAVDDSRQGRTDRLRAESLLFVESAAAEVLVQLRAHQVGPHAIARNVAGAQLWRVPGPAGRRPLRVTMPDGSTRNGYYEILAPVAGGDANTVAFINDPRNVQERGEVRLVLRGSVDVNDGRPRAAVVRFRRSSLANYAVVSDAPIDVGNLGTPNISGALHSNNVQGEGVGIRLAGANTARARLVSTTVGSISGRCAATRCVAGSEQAVSFTNVDRAFAEVERVHTRGGCDPSRRVACVHAPALNWNPAGTSPAYAVRLDGAGGCVLVSRIAMPLRRDAGASSIVDDRQRPIGPYGGATSYCPSSPESGFALMLNGDVQVEGQRSGPPITILSRSRSSTRQQPGSIYVVQRGSRVGSTNPLSPVGLIAEGSVYLPEWAIRSGNNRALDIEHVAIAAKEGELSLGPMTLAMAGSLESLAGTGADAIEGGGLNPCATEAASFGRGGRLRIVGAIATRREPVLGYGVSASCSFGYGQRQYEYSEHLEWNPPPLYPTTSPWHVAAWDELAVAG